MEELVRWVGDHGWAIWLAVAVLLGIIETTTLDLTFLMLAGGALAGGLTALIGAPVLLQAIVAIVVSAALLGVVRPIAKRHLRQPLHMRTGVAALIGAQGVALERVDSTGGRIKLAGEVWSARTYDPTAVIEPGQRVDVAEIDGATAVVFESEGP